MTANETHKLAPGNVVIHTVGPDSAFWLILGEIEDTQYGSVIFDLKSIYYTSGITSDFRLAVPKALLEHSTWSICHDIT